MSRTAYYRRMQALARDLREEYGFESPRVTRGDLRRIYKAEGIRIDLWPRRFKNLRGAYFNDSRGKSVLIDKSLPEDPRVFTMAHELKHHFVDQNIPVAYCDSSNQSDMIEIGAEVFAAELIFPQQDFAALLREMGVVLGGCTPEHLVRLKRETRTTLSYAGLAKRAEFLDFAAQGSFCSVKWLKLEEQLYGVPFYKRRRGRR